MKHLLYRYRSEEKSGLVHAIVGKNTVTERWPNDVFTAHVRIEIANLGRNIMHWIFQLGVSRGRQMLSTKNRQLADAVGSVLGVQGDSADMPKKSSAPKETLGVAAEAESKVDRSVRCYTFSNCRVCVDLNACERCFLFRLSNAMPSGPRQDHAGSLPHPTVFRAERHC